VKSRFVSERLEQNENNCTQWQGCQAGFFIKKNPTSACSAGYTYSDSALVVSRTAAPSRQERHVVRAAGKLSLALLMLWLSLLPRPAYSMSPHANHSLRVFEVRDFGASPDGAQDDSPAIQRAVDAASAADGGVVHFPCGEWRADAVLNGAPAQRSALYFHRIANIIFRGEGKCSRVFTSVPARTVFEIRESTSISFENLRIEPAAAVFHEHYQNDGGSGIRLSGVNGGYIRNVEMSGGSAALLWMNSGTSNYTVSRSYFHHAFGNSAIWEDDCSATDDSTGCGASLPPHGNSIENNLLVENGTTGGVAQLVLDSGGHVTNTRIVGNTVRGRPEPRNPHIHGIQVVNAGGALIEGNHIIDALDDCIAVTANDGITISDTQIIGNAITGGCGDAAIILYASVGGRVERTTISRNKLESFEGRGIVVHGTIASHIATTEISNNEIDYAASDSAHAAGADSSVEFALPRDVCVIRGEAVRLTNNTVSPADRRQQLWIRIDPDSANVSGVPSTRRADSGVLSIFDPSHVSDASKRP
jgi:hypothetical protein